MSDLTSIQRFTLLALNGQDSQHMTVAKRMALRCVAAGAIMETQLTRGFSVDSPLLDAAESPSLPLYQQVALELLAPKSGETALQIIARTDRLRDKQLAAMEKAAADSLKSIHALDEKQALLACDLLYDGQSMDLQEYRADKALYLQTAEGFRAEILEDEEMADENVLLFFLLRESGCIHDLFSKGELPTVDVQMQKAFRFNSLAKKLLPLNIHKASEMTIGKFLHGKKDAASADMGIALNFLFPAFERSQSVFIDTEALLENDEDFICHILTRLQHHDVEVLRKGKVPLLRIDNVLYEAVPSSVRTYKIPVYGARLRRYPLFY